MSDQSFKDAYALIKKIKKHGFQAYLVGGCVRDYLLNKNVNDIDITTSAFPEDIKTIFKKVIPVGIEHGTVIVRYNQVSYEVTTFRNLLNNDHIDDTANLFADLSKRDFTINAIAMDEFGETIDIFNGETDLANQIIKTVNSPYNRFMEDPLRIIRALRFVSQLNFDIEPATLKMMSELKSELKHVSVERITAEIAKFFSGSYINKGLNYLKETEIYTELPIFKENHNFIEQLPEDIHPFKHFSEIISYYYLINETITVNHWINAWKLSNTTKNESLNLIKALKDYEINGLNALLLYHLDIKLIHSFVKVVNMYYNDKLIAEDLLSQKQLLSINSRKELNINGNDIIKLFPDLDKGKWINEIIEDVEKAVLYKQLKNDNQKIKEWIKCNRQEIN